MIYRLAIALDHTGNSAVSSYLFPHLLGSPRFMRKDRT